MDSGPKPLRNPGIRWREDNFLDGTGLLIGEYGVNITGKRIWELCDGKHTLSEITEIIIEEFKADRRKVEGDVAEFIKKLAELELVSILC